MSKTILVVEDERPLLSVIRTKLLKHDFEVATARTVTQALSYLNDGMSVDAIWLDHYLFGKENGLDFVAQIKEPNSSWRTIPIFVVSNTVTQDKVQSYMRLGVVKYFTKVDHTLDEIIADITEAFEE